MNTENINLVCNGKTVTIDNRWESLTPNAYLQLVTNCNRMANGEMSPGEVRLRLLCDIMEWNLRKISDEESLATLIALAERLTFLFNQDNEGHYLVNLCFCAQLLPTVVCDGMTYYGCITTRFRSAAQEPERAISFHRNESRP